jgi:hydrogenase/urease accessory protein HupE
MTRALMFGWWALLLVLGGVLSAPRAEAHALDSATLTLTEVAPGRFSVDWQSTARTLAELQEPAWYPRSCRKRGTLLECVAPGLAGSIEFPWLESSESRVIVIVDWIDGSRFLGIANASTPALGVYGIPDSAGVAALKPIAVDYTRLGVEHILAGVDHLLFVLVITLLVRRRRALVIAITAFTLAHSVTLAATVLGWLALPSAAVETTIALSIVLGCAECLRPADSLARRAPWLVTFAFGLLHGMGFASALVEAGLPEKHVPSALLFFNVGVELGQLLAVAVFTAAGAFLSRIRKLPSWSTRAFVYAMGSIAAYWSLERGVQMFAG